MQNNREKRIPVRVVRDKDGNISVDPTGKKSGRGAYICNDVNCLETARKGRKLERSFKCQIPAEIYDIIAKELTSDK